MRSGLRYPPDDPRVVACKEAVKRAGGLTKLSRVFGVTPQAIYKWEMVPPERCQELAMLAGMSVHDLRPDIFGVKPRRAAS
jgi:DNA-binding transcriptional regulator YdaS (Cro superfamily)